jgi:peptidoglycan/xylan/chitin deacetylase (PgdA/CDA1 family)
MGLEPAAVVPSLKRLGRQCVARLGGGLSRLFGSRAGAAFGILTYHRVTHHPGRGPAPTWNVTPPRFRAQLEGLLARGYRPCSLRDALALSGRGEAPPPGTFVVTFDDGYENVYRHAWPVLRDLGIPATVFLTTAYLDGDGPFPFDDWPAAGAGHVPPESWKPLTTSQANEMLAGRLIDLGTHTHTHSVFRNQPEFLRRELLTSLDVLRERFGLADATFSFPFGIFGPDLVAAARRSGVLCSLTTRAALVEPGSDPFEWGRFTVEESDTGATLAARLDGWYGLLLGAARRLGRPAPAARPLVAEGAR